MNLILADILFIYSLSFKIVLVSFLIVFTAYYFRAWLPGRNSRNRKKRRVKGLIVAIAAMPLTYLGMVGMLMWTIDYAPDLLFSKSRWATKKEKRFQMARHIIQSKMLIGRDSTLVKRTLGEPARRSDARYQEQLKNSWFYNMGSGFAGLGFSFHTLTIHFEGARVSSVAHGEIFD